MKRRSIFLASTMNGVPIANALATMLEDDFRVLRWPGHPAHSSELVIHALRTLAEETDLAVFVLPSLDINTYYHHEGQLSSDLLFELGMLVGLLGLDRVLLVTPLLGRIEVPTHLQGLSTISYDPQDLHERQALPSNISPVADLIRRRVTELEETREKVGEFYSCFISYASQDQAFVTKLHEDLTGTGIRCWLDEKDLRIGDPIVKQISRAIDVHDKVLLVLSESSVRSPWVLREVQNATALELSKNRTFLFPIRIDDAVFSSSISAPLDVVRSRHIGDFRSWKQADAYRKSFSRLVRDLAISSSAESGGKGDA